MKLQIHVILNSIKWIVIAPFIMSIILIFLYLLPTKIGFFEVITVLLSLPGLLLVYVFGYSENLNFHDLDWRLIVLANFASYTIVSLIIWLVINKIKSVKR